MADPLSGPWNILKAYMGIPQPALAPPSGNSTDYDFNPFPSNITGGRLLAVSTSPDVAGGGMPAQTPPAYAGIPRNPGVPPPSGEAAALLQCMTQASPGLIKRITSTSEPYPGHGPGDPHSTNQAIDIATDDPLNAMLLGAACGAVYQQNEYTNPSKGSDGPHVHLQTRPGKGGAVGPYYPLPVPKPRPDY